MAEITAAMVRALRQKTDLPMMDCKRALEEAGGDEAKAIEILQRKARGKLETKADRETAEGRIGVFIDPQAGAGGIVEVRCETNPVAQTQVFADLCEAVARQVARQSEREPDPEALLAQPFVDDPSRTLKDAFGDVFGKVGENMRLARARRVAGPWLASYVHHDGKIGALVALSNAPSDERVGRELCMHIVFHRPQAITRDQISPDDVAKFRELARQVAIEEGKPEKIIDRIVTGKLEAWYAERVLLEQPHAVHQADKKTVAQILKEAGVQTVVDFACFRVGEQPGA